MEGGDEPGEGEGDDRPSLIGDALTPALREPIARSIANAETIRTRLAGPIKHVVAVTANVDAALDFGISPARVFRFWDWVGGRYSLWSAIGLPIALALGADALAQLLAGAAPMDQPFLQAPLRKNSPLHVAPTGLRHPSVPGSGLAALTPPAYRLRM